MQVIGFIALGLFIILALNAGLFVRWRMFNGEYPTKRVIIWSNIIMIIIATLIIILPKSNGKCKVNIIINNKNSISEIIIDKKYTYYLTENEKIKLENLDSPGYIAIKTKNDAFIGAYIDDTHLFTLTHRINIDIIENKIIIDSFPKIPVWTMIKDIEGYDKTIDFFKNKNPSPYSPVPSP